MGYSKYVGRVGALALALGIGTAVATPAWAESPSTSESASSESKAPQKPSSRRSTPATSGDSANGGDSAGKSGSDGSTASAGGNDNDSPVEDEADIEVAPEPEAAEDAPPLVDEVVEESDAHDGNSASAAPEVDSPSTAVPSDATGVSEAEAPAHETLASLSPDQDPEPVDTEIADAPTPLGYALAVTAPPVEPAPAPLVRQPRGPVGVILGGPAAMIDIAAKALQMLFNPGPTVPGDPPLLLGVLAFVRREIQRTFFNSSPTAVADTTSTSEGLPTRISVLDNDTDPNIDDVLTVTDFTQAANGVVELNADGSFTYTPTTGYSGTDTFTYTISDEASEWHGHVAGFVRGHTSTATVSVTVLPPPVNESPSAAGDSATTAEDTPAVIDVKANDSDPNGDDISIASVGTAQHGAVAVLDGKITYTPESNFHGTDTFDYTITDGDLSDTATVTVTVTPVNDAPVAVHDAITVAGSSVANVINVLGNDTDPDTEVTLTVAEVGAPNHGGTVTIVDGNAIAYTPAAGFSGTETFSYTVSDGELTDTATVTVSVEQVVPSNIAPSAYDNVSYYTTNENTTLNVFANDGLIEWDAFDPDGDALTAGLATGPAHGTLDLNPDGSFTYTPDFGFIGDDSFRYTVTDGASSSNIATVGISVTPAGSSNTGNNRPPRAFDDFANIRENTTLTVPAGQGLLSTRSAHDADGDSLTVDLVTATTNGHVSVDADGSYTYAPNDGYVGEDSFTYTISDGQATSSAATVTILVHAASEQTAPEAYGDDQIVVQDSSLTVSTENGLTSRFNAYDNEGDALTAALATGPSNGQVTVNSDGSYTYTPNDGYIGEDSFTYTVSDGQLVSAAATVYIDVQSNAYNMETGITIGPDGKVYVLHGTTRSNPDGTTGGSFHLASRNSDGSLTDLVQLSGASADSLPTGLAAGSDGRIYVADHLTGSITVYDRSGGYSPTLIASIPAAAGIALDSKGRIYVTTVDYTDPDRAVGQLWILDSTGTQIGRPIDLAGPAAGVAVASNGDVYVAGLSGGLSVYSHRVLQTNITAEDLPGFLHGLAIGPDGTAYIANWEAVSSSGELLDGAINIVNPADPTNIKQLPGVSDPWGVVYANGLLYVTSTATQSVITLDPANATPFVNPNENAGGGALDPYTYDVKTGIALGPTGDTFVIRGSVTYSPADGSSESTFYLARQNEDGSFSDLAEIDGSPTSLAVGPDGRLFVTDNETGIVTMYDPSDGYSARAVAAIPNAAGIAVDASGRIFVTTVTSDESGEPTGQLWILDATGSQIGQPVDLRLPSAGVAVASNGNVYAAGLFGGLAIFDPATELLETISSTDLPGFLHGIAVGPDGTAYIGTWEGSNAYGDLLNGAIIIVKPGEPTTIKQVTGVSQPWGIAFANGMILAVSADTQTVVTLNPADATTFIKPSSDNGSDGAGSAEFASASTAVTMSATAAHTAAVSTSISVSTKTATTAPAMASTANTANSSYGTHVTIDLDGTPTNVTLSANGTRGYVVVGNQVKIIELGASAPVIVDSVNVGVNPNMVAVNSFGTVAYVTNSGDGTVSIIDKARPTPLTVTVGSNPTGIALSANGTRAYVSNTNSNTVSIIDYGGGVLQLPKVVANVPVGSRPTSIAVNSTGTVAYVTNEGGDTVSIIRYNGSGSPSVSTVNVSAQPQSVKTDDTGTKAIVYSRGGIVTIINGSGSVPTATTVPGRHFSYADYPGFVAISSDGRTAFVTEHDSPRRVTIIDTANPGVTPRFVDLPDYSHSIVSLPDGTRAFTVAHDALWVIESKTGQATPVYVPADNNFSQHQRIAISSDGRRVIAADNFGSLTAFYLSGGGSVKPPNLDWLRNSPTASSTAVTTDSLLTKIPTSTPDTIRIQKSTDGGTTRVVVYISGVKEPSLQAAGSYWAVLRAKQGITDENMRDTINKAISDIEKDGTTVSEIMLVGFSKGGMTAQNYASKRSFLGIDIYNETYGDKVKAVITFASPLVRKADEYGYGVDVVHLAAQNDYLPRDEFFGGVLGWVDGQQVTQASNRGVRETFINERSDWKTIYTYDTKSFSKDPITRHSVDNYHLVAKNYDANASRWIQSKLVTSAITRFFKGTINEIDLDPNSPKTTKTF
uniref:40-residue YVTN family beta-propeller repeat protein n=1 Tax=Mycolicibacterium gilvum (strain PYR-GCK) TaxID=350054 RepID=A4TEU7_MYCGI|nr:40-residue YVTN family beta-propeller repeat protein [Mycolicibacterium gilvum PYR-GCK]